MYTHFAKIEGDTWAKKLQISSECKCCIRHNTNKPHHLAPWIDTPFNTGEINRLECKCPCRHNARFICRIFNNKKCPKYSDWMKCETILSDGYLTE